MRFGPYRRPDAEAPARAEAGCTKPAHHSPSRSSPRPCGGGLHGRGWRRRGRRAPCPRGGGPHMGERRSDGMGTSFRWDSANLPALSRLADALPCAQTPLCAHGSRRPTSTCVRESRNHAENRHSSWWGPSLPRATLLRSPSERSQSSRGPVSYTAPDHNPSPEAVECPVPGRNAWTASGHLDPTAEITRLSHDARDRRIPFVPDCDSSGHPAASPIPHR